MGWYFLEKDWKQMGATDASPEEKSVIQWTKRQNGGEGYGKGKDGLYMLGLRL